MSDQRVQQAQDKLDQEARAEIRTEAQIQEIKDYLDRFDFPSGTIMDKFMDWFCNQYDDRVYTWEFHCLIHHNWNRNSKANSEKVDTYALAGSFVDWIGD